MHGIMLLDMHIRDERVLGYIQERGAGQIPAREIATRFHCHENTARAILKRLAAAGYICVDRSSMRGGYFYRVISDAS